ncbi:MAG: hypothetical protein ACRDFB_09995, partial [Rhabdochlamydiaceae bacterium]
PSANTTTTNYLNYGWYQHNGQAMQFLNGTWYTTPQQGISQQTQNTNQQSANSNTQGSYSVSCTTTTGTITAYGSSHDNATANCLADQQNSSHISNQLSCENSVLSSTNACDTQCKNSLTTSNQICQGNPDLTARQQCLDQATQEQSSCLSTCSANEQSGNQSCDNE